MSLALIEGEIRRFLNSTEPEVLCIMGKWGVGKTYAWKKYLADVEGAGALGLKSYSYVSLFGLNSLEDLRFSIFENTVTGEHVVSGPDPGTLKALFAKGTELSRKMRPLMKAGFAFINRKSVGDALFSMAFIAVREQLICLDDLERAGRGLDIRDVLGLASFLKEERKCKVALLLNNERMNDADREEFNRQLEKVADARLTFDLSPGEAVKIALPSEDPNSARLRPRVIELGINNIRVIMKIERLATRLTGLLEGFDDQTLDQAVTTLTLAGWSVHQPDIAPPPEFIRRYNRYAIGLRTGREEVDPDTARWQDAIKAYPYVATDALDGVILDGAAAGYFDETRLRKAAKTIEMRRRQTSQDNAFHRAWEDLYHGSLATEDDEFLDALHRSAISDAKAISPLNINSAIRVLRECGRGDQADEVIEKYIAARSDEEPDFFNIAKHHFSERDAVDEALRSAFAASWVTYVDAREPLDVLRAMGQRNGWNDADIMLMAKQSAGDFEHMFETLRGKELKQSIDILMTIGRSGLNGADAIRTAAEEALRRIGAKSHLRAQKVRRYGITLEDHAVERTPGPVATDSQGSK